jgi:hypothetical protein
MPQYNPACEERAWIYLTIRPEKSVKYCEILGKYLLIIQVHD